MNPPVVAQPMVTTSAVKCKKNHYGFVEIKKGKCTRGEGGGKRSVGLFIQCLVFFVFSFVRSHVTSEI